MYLKKVSFLLFFYTMTCFSITKNIHNDTLLYQEKYKWIITNKTKLTDLTNIELEKNEIDSVFYIILKKLENNGYPFSTIEFRYDSLQKDKIYGKLFLEKGSFTKIDSVAIKGYNKFPKYLITRFLKIKINENYSQNKIDSISKKIQSNVFLKEYQRNSVLFNKEQTILFLYLEKKHNNSIDGFLGLNNNQGVPSLYGKVDLNLSNAINMWESIKIKWNKLTENSQELSLNFNFPFFLNSNFFLNTEFNILQYENTYINKEFISILEVKKKNNFLKLGYLNKRSSATNNSLNNSIQDYRKNLILFNWTNTKTNFSTNKMNYRISKEYRIGFINSTHKKNVRQKIALNLECKIPLFQNNNFYLNSNNEFLIGENILENEKIGVGGINQIRGFLENSFFSKSLSLISLENKYFFNNESYFSFFYDFGSLYDLNEKLESFGLGIGIDMGNDIFLINYAIPKYNENIEINNSKIHFNYILKF